ncbi:MAG: ferrous iron transport protein A [Clostridium sp.]|nr:ferrous iron transport protein A [Clostridium sp.]
MSKDMSLADVDVKSKAKVLGIMTQSSVRRKIMDMGIVRGTEIYVEGKAPMGDPLEIQVRGYNLSLRKKEAKDILVELI